MHLQATVRLLLLMAAGGRHKDGLPLGAFQDYAPLVAIALAPFVVWIIKVQIDRWEDRQRREDARGSAIEVAVTLARSIQLCENVRLALQTAGRVPDETVQAAIESLDLSRQGVRRYLARHIQLHELIPLAIAAERCLGDGCQAMLTLHGARRGGADRDALYAVQLQGVRAELRRIVDRLHSLEPDIGRAIAKVDAGWALD
jgi:hypothetical protein